MLAKFKTVTELTRKSRNIIGDFTFSFLQSVCSSAVDTAGSLPSNEFCKSEPCHSAAWNWCSFIACCIKIFWSYDLKIVGQMCGLYRLNAFRSVFVTDIIKTDSSQEIRLDPNTFYLPVSSVMT